MLSVREYYCKLIFGASLSKLLSISVSTYVNFLIIKGIILLILFGNFIQLETHLIMILYADSFTSVGFCVSCYRWIP